MQSCGYCKCLAYILFTYSWCNGHNLGVWCSIIALLTPERCSRHFSSILDTMCEPVTPKMPYPLKTTLKLIHPPSVGVNGNQHLCINDIRLPSQTSSIANKVSRLQTLDILLFRIQKTSPMFQWQLTARLEMARVS